MVSRTLRSFALAAAVFVALVGDLARAQTLPANHPGVQAHRAAARAERIDGLHRALVAARERGDGAALQRGQAALGRLRGPSAPALAGPSDALLNGWRRALESPSATTSVTAFADALEVMVVPGAFEATLVPSERERFAVRIWSAPNVPMPPAGTLRLRWVHPDGRSELVRTAEFEAAAFRSPGFDLFVRAPLTEPTTWRLVPEVEVGDERVQGLGVPVQAIEGLSERWAAIRADPGTAGGIRAGLIAELSLLIERGVRAPRGADLESDLALLDGNGEPSAVPCLFDDDLVWTIGARSGDGPVVVTFAAPEDGPSDLLSGERGRRWRRALARCGGALVALDADRAKLGALAAAIARVRQLYPERRLVLVPRGASAAFALLASGQDGDGDLDWVLVRTGPLAPGGGSLGGLLIGPSDRGPLPDDSTFDLVEGSAWPFEGELELPAIVADWWLAARAGSAGR